MSPATAPVPVTVTKYRPPGAVDVSEIEPPTVPPDALQVDAATTGPTAGVTVQDTSFEKKPEPVKPTLVPGRAKLGLRVICGTT